MRVFKTILITIVALVAAAALALGVVNKITLTHKITVLHHTVATQQHELHRQQSQLSTDAYELGQLQPLTAYSAGTWCSTPETDNLGDQIGTMYSPCTVNTVP